MLRAPTEPFFMPHLLAGVLAPLVRHQPRFRTTPFTHSPRRQTMLTLSVR